MGLNVDCNQDEVCSYMLVTDDKYLDNMLCNKENSGIMVLCDEWLASCYTTVDEYLLYKFFQRCGNELTRLGVETGIEFGEGL